MLLKLFKISQFKNSFKANYNLILIKNPRNHLEILIKISVTKILY